MSERKTHPQYTKTIDDRTVTTLFSVSGTIDAYTDRMLPGAFTKTFQERGAKILHLWAHDEMLPPIAVIKSLREIGRADLPREVQADFPDATGGAECTSEFLDTSFANDILTGLKGGAPMQASFQYDVLQSSFTNEDTDQRKLRVRNIKEVRLYEVSTCNLGANDATRGAKARVPSHRALKTVLRDYKAAGGMDMEPLWEAMSDCYDIQSAAQAIALISSLLSSELYEADDPTGCTQLITALRMLLAFASSELDDIGADLTQASVGMAAPELASLRGIGRQLTLLTQLKSGARNAQTDQAMIDAIHEMSVNLGATNCKGLLSAESGAKSRAERDVSPSLTLLRQKLAYLDFVTP